MFLILMVVGLAGLLLMAIPALGHHAHGLTHHAGAHGQAGHGGHLHAPRGGHTRATRFLPSPRSVFSFLALYGAFANLLVEVAHLPPRLSGILGLLPAVVVERLLVTPLWNLMFRFQAPPSAPLDHLVLSEAQAVTPFVRGRGIVCVAREGRQIQLTAQLVAAQRTWPVRVGDPLRIEEIDAEHEHATVSVPALEAPNPPSPGGLP